MKLIGEMKSTALLQEGVWWEEGNQDQLVSVHEGRRPSCQLNVGNWQHLPFCKSPRIFKRGSAGKEAWKCETWSKGKYRRWNDLFIIALKLCKPHCTCHFSSAEKQHPKDKCAVWRWDDKSETVWASPLLRKIEATLTAEQIRGCLRVRRLWVWFSHGGPCVDGSTRCVCVAFFQVLQRGSGFFQEVLNHLEVRLCVSAARLDRRWYIMDDSSR